MSMIEYIYIYIYIQAIYNTNMPTWYQIDKVKDKCSVYVCMLPAVRINIQIIYAILNIEQFEVNKC